MQAPTRESTFPYPRKCPFAPPEQYGKLMIEQMVSKVTLATGLQIWAVTGHDNIRRLLTDIRASASRKHANFTFYINAPRRGHLNRRSLARM